MTPDDRREMLELHGFSVARRSFAGRNGQRLYYVLQLLPDGTRGNATKSELDGRQCSIDLETGIWNQWGSGIDQPFEAGPWWEGETQAHEPISSIVESVDHIQATGFYAECQAAGFVLDPRGVQRITEHSSNWSATFNGRPYALLDQLKIKSIIDPQFRSYSLEEFLKQYQNHPSESAAGPAVVHDENPEHRTQKRFVSMLQKPVVSSGNNKQFSLF